MKKFLVILLMGLFLYPEANASTSSLVKEGAASYQRGGYKEAIDQFNGALKTDPHSSILNYNIGTAFYKNREYDSAIEHLRESLINADTTLKQKTYYNLGNTLYKSGIAQEQKDIASAIQSLEEALKEYEKSLIIDEEDGDVQNNYEFVKKELERLKQKKEQQKNQKNQQSQPFDKSQDKQNQQNQQERQNQQSKQNQEDQKKDENQEQPQQAKDNEEKDSNQNQKSQTSNDQDQADQRENQSPRANQMSREMTEKEAKAFLQDYQETEEPKGLLNLAPRKPNTREVEKDW